VTELDGDGDGWIYCLDCDDTDAALQLDDADNDGWTTCDGDCDDMEDELNWDDADNDGYATCDVPSDCHDTRSDIYPGAPELCDADDNDCDGITPADETTDADGDGFPECWDCDDNDPNIHPYGGDDCDGIDNDCNGLVDDGYMDADGDGFASCVNTLDCDDYDPLINPDATEICGNNVDEDCDGDLDCDDGDCTGALICETNMLTNPGFETQDLTGWSQINIDHIATVVCNNGNAYSGDCYLEITNSTSDANAEDEQQYQVLSEADLPTGADCTLSGYYRSFTTDFNDLHFEVVLDQDPETQMTDDMVFDNIPWQAPTSGWQFQTISFVINENSGDRRISPLMVGLLASGEIIGGDDLSFECLY